MPWITLTADHVKARIMSEELEIYERVGDQQDPNGSGPYETLAPRVPAVVEQVTARIRGKIRSNPRGVRMGPAGTIPDMVLHAAVTIVIRDMIGVPVVEVGFTNPRQKAVDSAEKDINDLVNADPKAFEDDPVGGSSSCPAFGGEPLQRW